MDDFSSVFGKLSPEQLQRWAEMQNIDDKQARLEQQLKQADALRTQGQSPHTTTGGAAMGGIASLLNTFQGLQQQKGIQGQMDQLGHQRGAGRAEVMQYLAQLLRGEPQQPQLPQGQPEQAPAFPTEY